MEKKSLISIPLWRQAALSVFIAANLVAIGLANWHPQSTSFIRLQLDAVLPPGARTALTWTEYYIRRYAYLVGFDPRWTMFSSMSTYTGMYAISAQSADGAVIRLPLPLQSRRTFWQRQLFDFKEPKFHSNLAYLNPVFRETYSRYLCRTMPGPGGARPAAIIWESEGQAILDQQTAARRGRHWDLPLQIGSLYTFPCPPAQSPAP